MRKQHRDGVKNRAKKETTLNGRAIHLRYALELPERAELAARHLQLLNEIFARLFADENFLTLLRAESMPTIPVYLKPVLEEQDMSAKAVKQNGGECVRTSHTARKLHSLHISAERSKTLCFEQLNLTICCRYIASLLKAPRVNRYLTKHYPQELCSLQNLLDEFEQTCQIVASNYDPR